MKETDTGRPDDDVKRLAAFCDAVMAIAMTLLVLDIDKPDPDEIFTAAQLHAALDQWNVYIAFALSFGVIAIYWRAHFRVFRTVQWVDTRLLVLTLVFLFGITFLPFPTAVLQDFAGQRVAVLLYSATLAVVGYTWTALWLHLVRTGNLVLPDAAARRDGTIHVLVPPVVFTLSFAVTWINPTLGLWCWVLIPVIGFGRRLIH